MSYLNFMINDKAILSFDVDYPARTAKLLNTPKEMAARPILLPDERTYVGIERRLNYYLNENKTLPKLVAQIETEGFYAPMQKNLRVTFDEVTYEHTKQTAR